MASTPYPWARSRSTSNSRMDSAFASCRAVADCVVIASCTSGLHIAAARGNGADRAHQEIRRAGLAQIPECTGVHGMSGVYAV